MKSMEKLHHLLSNPGVPILNLRLLVIAGSFLELPCSELQMPMIIYVMFFSQRSVLDFHIQVPQIQPFAYF